MEWKAEHAEALSSLLADENSIALLPQPFVSVAQNKDENIRMAIDITEEWDKIQESSENPSTLVMGVVVSNSDFVENNKDLINTFLDSYKESVDFVNTEVEEASTIIGEYDIVPKPVAQKAIPYSNIVLIEGDEMKDKLKGYLEVLASYDIDSVGGKLPEDDFFYTR